MYRIIKGPVPTRADFLSDKARRRRPRDLSEEGLRRHEGFSVWASEDDARRTARRFPALGAYIAAVEVPEEGSLEPWVDTPDHQTAYGEPDAFVQAVVAVVPAR